MLLALQPSGLPRSSVAFLFQDSFSSLSSTQLSQFSHNFSKCGHNSNQTNRVQLLTGQKGHFNKQIGTQSIIVPKDIPVSCYHPHAGINITFHSKAWWLGNKLALSLHKSTNSPAPATQTYILKGPLTSFIMVESSA